MKLTINKNSFYAKDNGRHSSSGGGEQRYPCTVCGKSYLRKHHLKRHITNECIGIEPKYLCDVCPARYKRSEDLKRHLLKSHNIIRSVGPQISRTIDDYVDDITTASGYFKHGSLGGEGAAASATSVVMERPLYVNEFETPGYHHYQRPPSPPQYNNKQSSHITNHHHQQQPPQHQPQSQHPHQRMRSSSSSDFDNQHFLDF
ncbi:uncharacterized protein [Musca autumnalis]|uniref:uncharacterized protein n=1 Tax=Musca autumnalis TaxID=221902 RepID=UPI003CED5995